MTHLAVLLALLALLGATLAVAWLDLGLWGQVLGMGLASAKAALVAAFFMHLKESTSLVRLAAGGALLWLALLFGLTLADYATRPILSPLQGPYLLAPEDPGS